MTEFIYNANNIVTFASCEFVNIPIIFQYDETPLITTVRDEKIGYTTQISVYHSDGTYLAKVRHNRVYATEDGKKAGVIIRPHLDVWECMVGPRMAFQVRQNVDGTFIGPAELHTPTGCFAKVEKSPKVELFDRSGRALQVGPFIMQNMKVEGFGIGVLLRSDGSGVLGVA